MKSRQQHIDYMLFYLDSVHFLSLGHWVCRTSSQLLHHLMQYSCEVMPGWTRNWLLLIKPTSGFSLLCLYYLIIHQPKKNKPFSKSLNEICIRNICSEKWYATQDHTNYTRNVLPSITKQYWYHESGLWTSNHSPPVVTRSSHGLLHYTTVALPPRTTVPIIHCTDDTHTAVSTDYTADSYHTPYLSHELPHSDRRVL